MKCLPNGLHVPDDYQPPQPKTGGWPPVIEIPEDVKSSNAVPSIKVWDRRGDGGVHIKEGRHGRQ